MIFNGSSGGKHFVGSEPHARFPIGSQYSIPMKAPSQCLFFTNLFPALREGVSFTPLPQRLRVDVNVACPPGNRQLPTALPSGCTFGPLFRRPMRPLFQPPSRVAPSARHCRLDAQKA